MKQVPYETLFLRINPKLKQALEAAAKQQHRSVNSLVEQVLDERFLPKKGASK